ncbi:BTAD domain-containing putative transcriptional regulator [Streptomyces sp. NPDC016845]|uniref:AfsR/SARP family transcriptional regulator n=1 Tax=Streptomyces sp. NPDC016845 TaxID=3364972 RepID=UPI003787FCC7
MASRAGCHPTTLQRAASGDGVPSARTVEAYARACEAPVDVAMHLWRQARSSAHYGPATPRPAPSPMYIDHLGKFKAALQDLYTRAGRPTVRDMESRAGSWGRLPHSTAHRIVQGQTVPRDEHQLLGFLVACRVPEEEHRPWIDAWRRALERASRPVIVPAQQTTFAARPAPPPLPPVAAGLRFSVLGPVRAWRGGEPLATGSPQQQALLATLLLRQGRTVTAGELIDAVWGEEPPQQALAAIRTYASRLRKVLGPDVLASESGGYAIRFFAQGALDVAAAEELCADAEKARHNGDLRQARTLLNKALGLWDGEPLANVPGPYAETQRTRLEEWRLQLLESRLDMDLEQGCHADAVSELTALTAAYPLRERLRELLMLALYRSGRQAEALAVYADTRRLLADELGVDPRPGLAALQQRILRADPALTEPPMPQAEPTPDTVRPAQLPATVPDFTGRAALVDELTRALVSPSAAGGRVMAISGVAGIGGIGKTTLAVHVAHQARPAYPDGQLYIDLQGNGPRPADPTTVLGAFLRALGAPDAHIPETIEERAALYRSLLDERRVLVLLDNARDAAQVRPLLPGAAGCAAMVTSQVRVLDLAGVHVVDLDIMSSGEALTLFTRIVGQERVAAEREAAREVVAACGYLPLAIRIAASRLAARRTWTVSVLAAKLADERGRLDELQAGDLAVRAIFELAYRQLEPAQAHAFRVLGAEAGPVISLKSARTTLDCTTATAEGLLENLVDAGMLIELDPGLYRFHDLARLYAKTTKAPGSTLPHREE